MGGVVAASLLVWRGHLWAALAVLLAVGGVLQAKAVSPAFAHRFERALGRVAHAVAHGVGLTLSWVLLSLVFVAVIVPVWVLGFPFRRRGLGRPRGVDGDGWVARAAAPAPARRGYAHERGFADAGSAVDGEPVPVPVPVPVPGPGPTADAASQPRPEVRRPTVRRRHPVLVGLGVILVLLLADLALGAALTGSGAMPDERGDVRRAIETGVSAMMATPPIATEPWAERYGADLVAFQLQESPYEPYLLRGFDSFSSPHLNSTTEGRVSYQPASTSGGRPLQVAFFGGSTMFGVGQRDERTIPSEVARLAERAGVPVEVHNFGHLGWVSWQELQYFERRLANGDRFDLAVFYDGFNEFLVQGADFSEEPTHDGAPALRAVARDLHAVHEQAPGYLTTVSDLAETYRRNSGIARLVDRLSGADEGFSWSDEARTAPPAEQATAALDIYARATRLIQALAADHDTPVRFFWQPTRDGWPPEVLGRLPAGVVDVSDTFGDRGASLYIDHVHTNEEGARLVAEAIWADIGPDLVAAAADTAAATEDRPTG